VSTFDYEVILNGSYTAKAGVEKLLNELSIPEKVEGTENPISTICLNITNLNYIEIGPLSLLRGVIASWNDEGKTLIVNLDSSREVTSYLQRMDFFKSIHIDIAEKFMRHPSEARFVVFTEINSASSQSTEDLSERMATCITGESDDDEVVFTDQPPVAGYFEGIAYSVSELIKNVQQHSCGVGHIVAQHYRSTGLTQIAIVDNGIGIKESFFRSSSPVSAQIDSDLDAIKLALEAEVSSKTHSVGVGGIENAGVGLTFLTEIARNAKGHFQVVSGNGFVSMDRELDLANVFNGTFVCITFDRNSLATFGNLLENARLKILGAPDSDLDVDLDGIFGG
jgi:hypothetical protein